MGPAVVRMWPQIAFVAWLAVVFLRGMARSLGDHEPALQIVGGFSVILKCTGLVVLLGMGGFFTLWGWAP